MKRPSLVVVIGANGAGKTTWARRHRHRLPLSFYNADSIAEGLGDANSPEQQTRAAEPGIVGLARRHHVFDVSLSPTVEVRPRVGPVDAPAHARDDFTLDRLRVRIVVPVVGCAPVLGSDHQTAPSLRFDRARREERRDQAEHHDERGRAKRR